MRVRDILAVVTSETGDEHVIRFAEQIAKQNAAILSSLVVNWLPTVPFVTEGWAVDPFWGDLVVKAQERLESETAKIRTRLEREQDVARPESLLLEIGAARSVIGMRARHSDVTIVGRPSKANSDSAHAILEGPLFESGRPVIVVPPNWKTQEIGRSVLVCWKPTREAARALGDADGFLSSADRVTVVTVDAHPSEEGYGQHPGADITAHLARRNMKVELVNLDSAGRSETKAIQDQALAVNADLIVMGGFGRSRMSEFIFGGVTREMLRTSPVPLFLAH